MELLVILAFVAVLVPVGLVVVELWPGIEPDWKQTGVIVHRADALEGHSETIGHYMDGDIWAVVRFKGSDYVFAHISQPDYRPFVKGGELFLEPGLLYVMRDRGRC